MLAPATEIVHLERSVRRRRSEDHGREVTTLHRLGNVETAHSEQRQYEIRGIGPCAQLPSRLP